MLARAIATLVLFGMVFFCFWWVVFRTELITHKVVVEASKFGAICVVALLSTLATAGVLLFSMS